MPDRLITLAEVADRLGIKLGRLHRVIRTLRERHGFPQPLPCMGGRYDPLAIDAWRARMRGVSIFSPSPAVAKIDTVADPDGADPYAADRALLLERAAHLGRRHRAA